MIAKNKVNEYTVLKCEDLVSNGNILQLDRIGLKIPEKKEVSSWNHTVAGNPVRFNPEFELKADVEYQRRLPTKDFLLTTVYTWPLLLLYRYRLTRQNVGLN